MTRTLAPAIGSPLPSRHCPKNVVIVGSELATAPASGEPVDCADSWETKPTKTNPTAAAEFNQNLAAETLQTMANTQESNRTPPRTIGAWQPPPQPESWGRARPTVFAQSGFVRKGFATDRMIVDGLAWRDSMVSTRFEERLQQDQCGDGDKH